MTENVFILSLYFFYTFGLGEAIVDGLCEVIIIWVCVWGHFWPLEIKGNLCWAAISHWHSGDISQRRASSTVFKLQLAPQWICFKLSMSLYTAHWEIPRTLIENWDWYLLYNQFEERFHWSYYYCCCVMLPVMYKWKPQLYSHWGFVLL